MDWLLAQASLVWMLIGLVLMVLEVLLPGAFLIWLGIAALGSGLVLEVATLDFSGQVILFAAFAIATIALALALRRGRQPTGVNAPGSGLVGRHALALGFEGQEGRVRLGDSDWPARLAVGSSPPPEHTRLLVVGVEGTVLVVKPEMNEA